MHKGSRDVSARGWSHTGHHRLPRDHSYDFEQTEPSMADEPGRDIHKEDMRKHIRESMDLPHTGAAELVVAQGRRVVIVAAAAAGPAGTSDCTVCPDTAK